MVSCRLASLGHLLILWGQSILSAADRNPTTAHHHVRRACPAKNGYRLLCLWQRRWRILLGEWDVVWFGRQVPKFWKHVLTPYSRQDYSRSSFSQQLFSGHNNSVQVTGVGEICYGGASSRPFWKSGDEWPTEWLTDWRHKTKSSLQLFNQLSIFYSTFSFVTGSATARLSQINPVYALNFFLKIR